MKLRLAPMAALPLALTQLACGGGASPTSASTADTKASTPTAAGGSAEARAPANAALAPLRAALDRARAAPPDQDVRSATGKEPLDALVGLTRGAIRASLGEPHTCERNEVRDARGQARPVAPCESNDDWFYSFYHLPASSLGGGPELLLTFDAAGVCRRAIWMFTQ